MKKYMILFLIFLATVGITSCNNRNNIQNNENNTGATTLNNEIQENFDIKTSDTQSGKILTDGKGMTLYIFTRDTNNNSVCYNTCAINWPPLLVNVSPNISPELKMDKFTVITRTDGTRQVTYEGQPLYYYIEDRNVGDVIGEGVGGVWYTYKLSDDDLNK